MASRCFADLAVLQIEAGPVTRGSRLSKVAVGRESTDVLDTFVAEQTAHCVEPFNKLTGDRGIFTQSQRASDDQNIGRLYQRPDLVGPTVSQPAVLAHVRVNPGRHVVIDKAHCVDMHAVIAHESDAAIHQPLRVGFDALLRQQRFGAPPQLLLDALFARIGIDAEHAREIALKCEAAATSPSGASTRNRELSS